MDEECDHKMRSKRPGDKLSPRRSDRLRNVSGGNQDHQTEATMKRSRRRRYNSVMDEQEENDNHEDEDLGDKQRQEPEHRQLNRMKMRRLNAESDPPVQPPEEEDSKEKSLVEIFLRKYGFGRWTLPPDDSSETAEKSTFSRTEHQI